jgi:hypothetical protein
MVGDGVEVFKVMEEANDDDEFESEGQSDQIAEAVHRAAEKESRPTMLSAAGDEEFAASVEEEAAVKGERNQGQEVVADDGDFFSLAPDGPQGGGASQGDSLDWADLKGLKQFEAASDTTSMQVQDSALGEDPLMDDFISEKPDASPLGGTADSMGGHAPQQSGVDPFADMFGEVCDPCSG